jgi:hypothetical protein
MPTTMNLVRVSFPEACRKTLPEFRADSYWRSIARSSRRRCWSAWDKRERPSFVYPGGSKLFAKLLALVQIADERLRQK